MHRTEASYDSKREQQQLLKLIREARQHPNGSHKYRKLFNKILSIVQNSHRRYEAKDILQNKSPSEYDDIYGVALQRAYIDMNRNLKKYNETICQFMTWFNNNLKWRIKDVLRERKRQYPSNRIYTIQDRNGQEIDPLTNTPDPGASPQEIVEAQYLQEWLLHKIEENREELSLVYIRNRPGINAYKLLIYLILLWNELETPSTTLKKLANEIKIDSKKLKRFYRERCLRYARQYIKEYKGG